MALLLTFLFVAAIQPGSGEFHQPQLASAHGQVAMTFGGGTAIYFARSADAGRTFSPPAKVADLTGLMLGRHRGPRLSILPNALVISAIGSEGDLKTWRSLDHGSTWQPAGIVNDQSRAAREGLHAMVADAHGNLFAAWLDDRAKVKQLYGSRSTDAGRTWSKNVLIYASPDGPICQCCDPSLAIDKEGGIWAMWRNLLAGNRDLYIAHSDDGLKFGPAQKLGSGSWTLNACPMDGGGLAIDNGQVVSAWRRGGEVFLARPGQPEARLGQGKDVAIAEGRKGPYVIWSTPAGIELHAPGSDQVRKLSSEGAYPSLVSLPDSGVLAAWEEKGAIRVERLP